MTKKDFELIARILRVYAPRDTALHDAFATELSDRNPRFDWYKFKQACKPVK